MADTFQPFDLFITCVDKFGPMLTIWGQTDRNNSMFIEQLLRTQSLQFESTPVVPRLSDLSVNLLCCAKYRDGFYYRARITNLRNLVSGSVEVLFIDYGNAELIAIENIRLLTNVPAGLTNLKPQATNFVLASMMNVNRNWDEASLTFIHQEIAYMELKSTVIRRVNERRFVKIIFHETDLAEYLVEKGIAVQVGLDTQEAWIQNYDASSAVARGVVMSPQVNYMNNHAPAMQQQMHPAMMQQLQLQQQQQQQLNAGSGGQYQQFNYKTLPLPPNSEHMVYVSYVEDGPYLFSIQLQSQEDVLERLMNDLNVLPTLPLAEPPVPGYACMARCLEDNTLCRAVVINIVEEKFKTYYVDFGNTDILPFTNIFQIPFKYILPKVMSMRFTLAGLRNINVTTEMKCAFKEFVTNKLLRLKVLRLDSSPVIQYCELYDGDKNILNILYDSSNDYKTIQISKGQKYNVIVSYITGCKKFFVQLKEYSIPLNNLMMTLVTSCETTTNLQEFAVGTPCVAFYSGDNQWYRAQIISVDNNSVTVRYVDYGNEDTVAPNCLKTIDPTFVKQLPAQAIECCLCGYQNMSFNDEIESVFESLTLECEFTMKVISKQNNDTLLVDLFDETGNNVAALLIERLAAQTSQISPLPSQQIARSLFSTEEITNLQSPRSEHSVPGERSPARNGEQPSWRNSSNNNSSRNAGNERTSWRNTNTNNERNSWRNTENPPPNDNGSWNGDSPTNKRFNQRTDRHDQQRPHAKAEGKSNRFAADNKRSPRSDTGRANNSFTSGSESEKSFGSRSGKKFNGKRDFKQNKDYTRNNEVNVKRKVELPPQILASLEQQYKQMDIIANATEKVAISWFYNPENFYCQILTSQKEFRDMMCEIQSAYNGRSGVTSAVSVGASVIAEFPEDTILYRATILENKHPKYKVQYIDFGNISLVDISKLWQVEQRFMNIPKQAVKCTIAGIKSTSDTWPGTETIDNLFNKESFTAVFETIVDVDQYAVQLYDNDVSIKQQLVDSGVAIDIAAALQMNDEPVDLNILLGQNIYCQVSFIHGYEKFFVYLEKEKVAEVQEAINTFMKTATVTSLQQFTSEQLQVGAACITKVAEDCWYRGVLRTVDNPQALQIDYPDLGSSGEHTIDEIYALPQQLCVYWYQAFECSLHNYSDSVTRLLTDEDFKTNYEGKDVLLYVDEIIENRIVGTLYEPGSGTKLNLFEPDEGAYASVEPICALPVLASTLTVWVSHINSASSLYLQRSSDQELIAVFLEQLYAFYEASEEQTDLSVGDLCCAKSELDENWYRGRVESKTDDSCTVLYIDYGNSETISKENLRTLDPQFYNTSELALNVGLNLKEISTDLTAKLTELTADKPELKAVIFYAESGWLVDLYDGETSINQTLIALNLAAALEEEEAVEVQEIEASVPVELAAEVQEIEAKVESINQTLIEQEVQEIEVNVPVELAANVETAEVETHDDAIHASIVITHVDSPSEFYVQLAANEESIADLQADLQERAHALPELQGADIGVLCAAKYSVDEQWYRAEVLDADADITTVRFVDYGNTDVITNNNGGVKTLPADLLAIDKYASKCSLNIAPAKGEEWPQEAIELFESAVYSATTLQADIVYQDEKSKTFIELFVDGKNIAQQMLAAKTAIAIVRHAEENITGFVSHLNSIAEFWIQLESSVPDLEMIVDRLAAAETFPDLQDLSPGILCAANFPDDEMWYRARILSNTVAGIEVLFVDYGNSSTAWKLKVLPEDLVQMPILAQKCALQKPSSINAWSEQAIERFREISADGVTIFTIKKLTAGETSVVELFMDGRNVLEQLVELCALSSLLPPIKEPSYEKIHITHVESPGYFWVQQAGVLEKIDQIMENLAAAGSFKRLTDWDSDTTCAALYTDSGLWYRAKILEFTAQYEVLLIDYGNTLCTSEVRMLPDDLATAPPLATLCALEFPPNVTDWSDLACAKFSDVTASGFTDCRAEFLDGEFPSTVRLFIDGKNVAEEICSTVPHVPKQNAVSTALKLETVALAESTPLPEADLDGNEEEAGNEEEVLDGNEEVLDGNEEEVLDGNEEALDRNEERALDGNEKEALDGNEKEALDGNEKEALDGNEKEALDGNEKEALDGNEKKALDGNEEKTLDGNEEASLNGNEEKVLDGNEEKVLDAAKEALDDEKEALIAEEETKAADTTLYEECDTTLKEEANTSFLSCAGDTTTNLEVDTTADADTNTLNTTNTSCEEHLPDTDSNGDVRSGKTTVLTNLDDNHLQSTAALATKEELPIEDKQVHTSSNNEPEVLTDNRQVEDNSKTTTAAATKEQQEVEDLVDNEIQEINQQITDEQPKELRSRSITPHSEKIVPGAVSRGVSLEEIPNSPEREEQIPSRPVTPDHPNESKDDVPNRAMTPHQDKIVPGSISRGDLEQVPPEVIPIRPVTPLEDKIVPGAVSRGVSLEEIPKTSKREQLEQNSDEPRSRPITPHCDKIVPGSICRGDLESPAEEISEQSVASPTDKMSPGAISNGDKQTEDQNKIIPEAK